MSLNKIIFICGSIILMGCQQFDNKDTDKKSVNMSIPSEPIPTKIDNSADSSATSIARYKVASKDSIFMTARLQGKLELKDNCLVIQQEGEPKPYLLALPISDDSSEWKIDLVGNQLLYKDKKYKLGEKLDLGGGFMEYSKLMVKPKGCENYGVWAGYILRSLSK